MYHPNPNSNLFDENIMLDELDIEELLECEDIE